MCLLSSSIKHCPNMALSSFLCFGHVILRCIFQHCIGWSRRQTCSSATSFLLRQGENITKIFLFLFYSFFWVSHCREVHFNPSGWLGLWRYGSRSQTVDLWIYEQFITIYFFFKIIRPYNQYDAEGVEFLKVSVCATLLMADVKVVKVWTSFWVFDLFDFVRSICNHMSYFVHCNLLVFHCSLCYPYFTMTIIHFCVRRASSFNLALI